LFVVIALAVKTEGDAVEEMQRRRGKERKRIVKELSSLTVRSLFVSAAQPLKRWGLGSERGTGGDHHGSTRTRRSSIWNFGLARWIHNISLDIDLVDRKFGFSVHLGTF